MASALMLTARSPRRFDGAQPTYFKHPHSPCPGVSFIAIYSAVVTQSRCNAPLRAILYMCLCYSGCRLELHPAKEATLKVSA